MLKNDEHWLIIIQSNDFLREIWGPRLLISAGGYTRELALEIAKTKGGLIAVGRLFISNVRLQYTLALPMRVLIFVTLCSPTYPCDGRRILPP